MIKHSGEYSTLEYIIVGVIIFIILYYTYSYSYNEGFDGLSPINQVMWDTICSPNECHKSPIADNLETDLYLVGGKSNDGSIDYTGNNLPALNANLTSLVSSLNTLKTKAKNLTDAVNNSMTTYAGQNNQLIKVLESIESSNLLDKIQMHNSIAYKLLN